LWDGFIGLGIKRRHCRKLEGSREEKPEGRKLREAKKEEEFSANFSKKIQRKKIHFQTARYEGIPFRP
jgi:hypothetical protein